MRKGFTLVELLVAVTVIGVLAAMALPQLGKGRDRYAVRRAADEAAIFFERSRFAAVLSSRTVRIAFAPHVLTAAAEGSPDSLVAWVPGPARRGVELVATRRVIRLSPSGLGFGAANTKLVFRRRQAAESLTVSRLGRLKRWR